MIYLSVYLLGVLLAYCISLYGIQKNPEHWDKELKTYPVELTQESVAFLFALVGNWHTLFTSLYNLVTCGTVFNYKKIEENRGKKKKRLDYLKTLAACVLPTFVIVYVLRLIFKF